MHTTPTVIRRGAAALFAGSLLLGAAACGDDDAVDVDVDEEQLEEDVNEGVDDLEENVDEGTDEIEQQIDEGTEEDDEDDG